MKVAWMKKVIPSVVGIHIISKIQRLISWKFILFSIWILQVSYIFLKASVFTYAHDDSRSIWLIKAKVLFFAMVQKTSLSEMALQMEQAIGGHYPILMPAIIAFFNLFRGQWHDFGFEWLFPLHYVLLLFFFFYFLRKMKVEVNRAFIFTFFLGTLSFLTQEAAWSIADVFFTFYYFSSFLFLILYFTFKKYIWLYLSLLFSVLTLWTKMEGIPSLLINNLILWVFMGWQILQRPATLEKQSLKRDFLHGLIYSFICFVFLGAYFYYQSLTGVYEERLNLSDLFQQPLGQLFSDIFFILRYHLKEFFLSFNKWNLSVYLLVFYGCLSYKKIFKAPQVYLGLCLILNICLNVVVYLMLPGNFREQMGMSINRLILHIMPFILFYAALLSKEAPR